MGGALLVAGLIFAVSNRGKESYARCEAAAKNLDPKRVLEGGQQDALNAFEQAKTTCETTVKDDPKGEWGTKAQSKLTEIQSKLAEATKLKEDQEKEAAAARQQEQAAAQAAAAARIQALRTKVHRKYEDDEPDGECTGKSLPPYRWSYEGGTYAEDREVAQADGCTKLHVTEEIQIYCCPKRPVTF